MLIKPARFNTITDKYTHEVSSVNGVETEVPNNATVARSRIKARIEKMSAMRFAIFTFRCNASLLSEMGVNIGYQRFATVMITNRWNISF